MKRCPECRRDYYDDTLLYCLDDGNALLEGPASADEPATAILSEPGAIATGFPASESPTRTQIDTTDQTAILRTGTEAEPQGRLDHSPEKQSFSANRAAKPQETLGSKQRQLALVGIALVILVGGFFGYRYFARTRQITSIAVMPFVNQSGNADVEYLSDGITETLIGSLSRLPDLSVKALSSVFRYKGRDTDVRTVGKELNVQAIVKGRVVQRGQDLVLNVELIDAETENVLWTENYSRQMANLVSLHNEITRDVSQKLQTKLSGADMQKMTKTYTANPEALQLYLRGRFYWNKRTRRDVEKSLEYFQQAILIDPNYALAYAGLADAYALPEGGTLRERAPKARDAALKALALDDELAEAHTALGHVLARYDLDFAGGERAFQRAIELNPSYVTAHQRYSELLSILGRHEESAKEISRALELEPLCLVCNSAAGQGLLQARKYDDSIVQLKRTLELDANFIQAHRGLAWAYWMTGNYAGSVEERAKVLEIDGDNLRATRFRESFAKGGWQGYLRYSIEDRGSRPTGYQLAFFHAALGEKDKAFEELNRSFENHDYFIAVIKVDPRLDPLRGDPRFQELLRKVGFPE